MEPSLLTVYEAAGVVPKSTAVAPVKPLPVMVTLGAVRGSDHVIEVMCLSHMIEPRRWSPAS